MIIYEVNIRVKSIVVDQYRSWLPEHIRHLLEIDGFCSADLLVENEQASLGNEIQSFVVQYRLKDLQSLETYFENQAPRMRQAVVDLFGNDVSITRRVLKLEATFQGAENHD